MRIILLFVVFLLASCAGDVNSEEAVKGTFFSLVDYFQTEIERLESLEGPFEKMALVGGEEEKETLDSIDFAGELKIFSEKDINRPAWSDKYSVDTTFTLEGDIAKLEYRALDAKLRARAVSVHFSNDEVNQIEIRSMTESAIASSEQWLDYQPNKGYSVRTEQATRGAEKKVVEIKISF